MKSLIALAALAFGMGTVSSGTANASTRPFVYSEAANEFGLLGFQELLKEQGQQNIVYSPISAHLALGMLLNGAGGSTLTEISDTLKIPVNQITASNAKVLSLLKELNNRPKGELILSLNNALFPKPNYVMKPAYVAEMKNSYQALVAPLLSPATVNGWADEKTNGLIKKVVEDIGGLEMILANATYFKADWSQPFETAVPSKFNTLAGTKRDSEMMHKKTHARYLDSADYEAVELTYGSKALASMVVVLPKKGQDIAAFSKKISAPWFAGVVSELSETDSRKGHIFLPKFDFKTEWKMNDALAAMGMRTAFTGGADFSKMSESRVKVSYVKQDAVIKVHEKGTEAAAVTSIGMEATSVDTIIPFNFRADRPFYYFIRDNASGVILFAGQVVQ